MKRKLLSFLLAATMVISMSHTTASATSAEEELSTKPPARTVSEETATEPTAETAPKETGAGTTPNTLAAVYLDGVHGVDTNDAATPGSSIQSIDKALELVADGGTVFIVDSVQLIDAGEVALDGGARSITFKRASESAHKHALFHIEGNTTFTLRNVEVDADGKGSCFSVKNGATFNIQEGAKITGAEYGAVNANTDPGKNPTTLNMTGGTISNNRNDSAQGNVSVGEKCVFNMSGGAIENNSGTDAGGVYVDFPIDNSGNFVGGKFYMTGGTIAGNTSNCGGGIQNYGYCELTGGIIKNNYAAWGGGVATCGVATTILDGVEITENSCNGNGAGVYVEGFNPNGNPGGLVTGKATVTMRSGSITNNVSARGSGGGIYGWAYEYPTTIEVSGGSISGNKINEHGIGAAIALSGDPGYDYCRLKLSGSPTIQGEVFMCDDLFGDIKVDVVGDFLPTEPVVLEDTSWTNFRTVVSYEAGLTRNVEHFTTIEPVPPRDVMPDKADAQKILSINKLAVEFYSDNDLKGSIYVVPGTTIGADEVPKITKAGYTLTGWALRDGAGWDMTTDTVTENATKLYAQWEKSETANYYDLSFETNGGTAIPAQSLQEYATIQLTQIPLRQGYLFEGWYADKDLTEKITSVYMDRDMTVYAKWKQSSVQPSVDPNQPTKPDNAPQTGDASMIGFWMALSILSGLGLIVCIKKMRDSR